MEKTLSIIALVFAVSLAACQQQPVNAPAPAPIESPIQQTNTNPPVIVEPPPSTTVSSTASSMTTRKVTSTKRTTTPRLDDAIRRIERLEKLARQFGAQL